MQIVILLCFNIFHCFWCRTVHTFLFKKYAFTMNFLMNAGNVCV